jgi:endonuclease YncB( thermonuclease family)
MTLPTALSAPAIRILLPSPVLSHPFYQNRAQRSSHLSREPADPPDDVDLLGRALIGAHVIRSCDAVAEIAGRATVIHGDIIEIRGQRVRLFGIESGAQRVAILEAASRLAASAGRHHVCFRAKRALAIGERSLKCDVA